MRPGMEDMLRLFHIAPLMHRDLPESPDGGALWNKETCRRAPFFRSPALPLEGPCRPLRPVPFRVNSLVSATRVRGPPEVPARAPAQRLPAKVSATRGALVRDRKPRHSAVRGS